MAMQVRNVWSRQADHSSAQSNRMVADGFPNNGQSQLINFCSRRFVRDSARFKKMGDILFSKVGRYRSKQSSMKKFIKKKLNNEIIF